MMHPVIARSLAAWAPLASDVHQAATAPTTAERASERRRIEDQQRWLHATQQATDLPRDFNSVESRL